MGRMLSEGEERSRGARTRPRTQSGEKGVADDFRLLFKAIAVEWLTGDQVVGIATKGMAHQRQVESAAFLGLPYVRHLVDEQTLQLDRLTTEISRPAIAFGVEMDVAGRRHDNPARLQRPPFAADQPHTAVID